MMEWNDCEQCGRGEYSRGERSRADHIKTESRFGDEDERETLKRVVERENGRVMDLKVERAPSGESINLCLISL